MANVNRRTVLTALGAAALGLAKRGSRAASAGSSFRVSLSVDPFTEQVLSRGITYADGTVRARDTESLQRLYMAHGATEVYARIRTKSKVLPGNGDHGIERGLERARLAKKLNLPFNPELGLWGTYGDMSGQPPPDFSDYPQLKVPGPWHTLSIDQMTPILRGYGALVAEQIMSTGVTVNYWDLGNEVNFGVAGVAISTFGGAGGENLFRGQPPYVAPDGVNGEIGKMTVVKLRTLSEEQQGDWLSRNLWPYTGKMFAAVAEGVRSVDKSAKFSTHVGPVGILYPELMVRFFQVHRDNGYLPDQLGTSFYPSIDSRMINPHVARGSVDVMEGMKVLAKRLNDALRRGLFIAEFSYPASKDFTYGSEGSWVVPLSGYDLTPQGQSDLTRDLTHWGAKTGLLTGIRPWAPGLCTLGWGPMSCFDLQGKLATARPSLDAMAQGLRHLS
jgi:hypothetical protein